MKLKPPFFINLFANLQDTYSKFYFNLSSIKYKYALAFPSEKQYVDLTRYIEGGQIKILVGEVVKFNDLEGIVKGAERIESKKGGIGKFVVEMS